MNIIFDLDEYNNNNIHFLDSKKNTLMDGKFTKLLYSNKYFTTISLYLDITLNILLLPTNIANKTITRIEKNSNNNNIIKKLYKLEEDLLNQYLLLSKIDKKKNFILNNSLVNGIIKIYKKENKNFNSVVLKISGIWETEKEIGITYKFIEGIDFFKKNSYS